ncbi:MAG: A/G-specific adenine glycosylase [Fibrobacterota bacterium]
MTFAARVIGWQKRAGRHALPWQGTRDPYRIWLSEVMLQQTQVATVIPYYRRFLRKFTTVRALARARLDSVLALWSGLGYYARARNLHRAAQIIGSEKKGRFPLTAAELMELPGIGRSTAGAIAVFAAGEKVAILDGNVKRILGRCFGLKDETPDYERWKLAESLLPEKDIEAYTQGLMDLGATLCLPETPQCDRCPVHGQCVFVLKGSDTLGKRPSRKIPIPFRKTAMHIHVKKGRFLLVQRPERGIWGGLWSLPESKAPNVPKDAKSLPPFVHTFSHFRLEIHPMLIKTGRAPRLRNARWFLPKAALKMGLPAPVRKIIAGIQF